MAKKAVFMVLGLESNLLHADILASAEYYETRKSKVADIEPEKRLMLAVLADAIDVYQAYVSKEKNISYQRFTETEQWILDEDVEWPYSFENICAVLGFDQQYVRSGLQRWREQHMGRFRRVDRVCCSQIQSLKVV